MRIKLSIHEILSISPSSICISEVNRIFSAIKRHLGDDVFKETFPCILTDNRKEFKDPLSIEISANTENHLPMYFIVNHAEVIKRVNVKRTTSISGN